MNAKNLLIIFFFLLLTACGGPTTTPTATDEANMPNPASVFCEEQGGKVEIVTADDGSQSGFCVFEDGSKCDEWAFYRGECKPGEETEPGTANLPNPASVFCEEQGGKVEIVTADDGSQSGFCVFEDGSKCDEWAFFRGECKPGEIASDGCRIYRNETLGYRFHYPADAAIIQNDDPLKSITVSGPEVNGEHWPQYTISHPSDREEFRPPEGTDLNQWLADHNLVQDFKLQDVQIAGTTAVHVRFDGSPQSYAFDQYYFAKSGQLYVIIIGHGGNKEDWDLYNHFLESFQFDK